MISIVEKSGDMKLSATRNVSATWVPQVTCPDSCPLKNNGCYAETGNAGFQTRRLNALAAKANTKRGRVALIREIATLEAAGIRKLSGDRQLRVHVVGDCTDHIAASLVGGAMLDHTAKQGKAAWTYTHAWRTVPKKAWVGAAVVASCDHISDIPHARAKGYGTSVLTPKHPTNHLYKLGGETIIPCPAQFKHNGHRVVTCEFCTLCKRPDFLREKKLSVGFEPDGTTGKKVIAIMASK